MAELKASDLGAESFYAGLIWYSEGSVALEDLRLYSPEAARELLWKIGAKEPDEVLKKLRRAGLLD